MSEAATIDSAPRDGTHILGKDGFWREMWLVRDQYEGEFWRDEFDSEPEPTHWAPLPDAEAVKTSPEVGEMVERFPEINPSNYDHDDACALNAWGCEAHSLLIALDAERGRMREALKKIANGREVMRDGHTEVDDVEDAAEIARSALPASDEN